MIPISAVFYGASGSGKTSLAAHFPNCKFIVDSQEMGIRVLSRRNLVPKPRIIKESDVTSADSWEPLLQEVRATIKEKVDTLVCESVTGFEKMCFNHHCRVQYNGDFSRNGFFSYQQGPKSAARVEWPLFIDALDAVWKSGKNVIVTGHSMTKDEPDPFGVSVMKFVPYADAHIWAGLHRWASLVAFCGKRIEEDKSKRLVKKVAKEDFQRLLYVEGTPYHEAKNWWGLRGVVDMGDSGKEAYANLMEALGEEK